MRAGRHYQAPPPLRRGDRVRVIAPSGPVQRERFERGLTRLRDWGLTPVFDDALLERDGFLAGPDRRRQSELAAALADPEATALWAARGGYGATRLLPGLNASQLVGRPRWLVGFSDLSALHARWQRAGLQSLHAANVTGLDDWDDAAREELRGWLFETTPLTLRGAAREDDRRVVSGPLLGGNLTVLAAMVGTAQLPSFDGAVVFFEDVGEAPYRLDRCLTQLKQSGALAGAAGFAIGQLTGCGQRPGRGRRDDALAVVRDALTPLGKPLLYGLPVGHERRARPLPLGAAATLDLGAGELRFETSGRS